MNLAALEIILEPENENRVMSSMGSLFHGWLMDWVNPGFAERVHSQGLKPFSQHLWRAEGQQGWRICTLDSDAYQAIVVPMLEKPPHTIVLKSKGLACRVSEVRLGKCYSTYKELADLHYLERPLTRRIAIKTSTPVSFRSDGEYQIFPRVFHIFQSLVNRWNAFADSVSLEDEETIAALVKNCRITAYQLKSSLFHLEGVRIPAFDGRLELTVGGPEALGRLTAMLMDFGQYSGLGIKTALGMGGIQHEDPGFFRRRDRSGGRQCL